MLCFPAALVPAGNEENSHACVECGEYRKGSMFVVKNTFQGFLTSSKTPFSINPESRLSVTDFPKMLSICAINTAFCRS